MNFDLIFAKSITLMPRSLWLFCISTPSMFCSPTSFFCADWWITIKMCLESHFYLNKQVVKNLNTVTFSLIIRWAGNAPKVRQRTWYHLTLFWSSFSNIRPNLYISSLGVAWVRGKEWTRIYRVWICLPQNIGILVLFNLHLLNYQIVWDII